MPVYRRIVEVQTQEEKNLFRTVRVDSDSPMDDDALRDQWDSIIAEWAKRYETMVRFVPQREGQNILGWSDPLPGETTWDWWGEEQEEF